MKKGWKILIAVIVIIALIVFVAKLIIGSKIKPIIEKEASKVLGTPVHIGGIRIGFLTGDLGVKDFSIANPAGFSKDNLFSFDAFGVKVSYPALLKKQIVLKQVYLNRPVARIEMLTAKKSNVLALLANMPKQKEVKKEAPLPSFWVKKVTVNGGQVKLVDSAFSRPTAAHSLDNLKFELRNLTNLPNPPKDAGQFKLTGSLDKKSPILVEGKLVSFEKKISFNVKGGIKNIILTDFGSYFNEKPVALSNGQASVGLTLDCLKEILSGLALVEVKNLQVAQKTATAFTGNLAGNLAENIKDSKGLVAFTFKIGGTLKKPIIGFMDAIDKLVGNMLGNVARKVGEKVAEEAKSKAVREVTKGIKIGF